MNSRNLIKFSRYKSSKIRRNLAANPIRLNLITFYFDFLRRFQNWFHIFDTSRIRRGTASVSMNSRDLVEFSRYKNSKIRRNLVANSIRLNLTTFYFRFLRRFQNWFHIFDTSHIRRETASVPMNSLDFVEIFQKSAWNFFIKSAASPIGT